MVRNRSGDFPRRVVCRLDTQAFGKGNIRDKVEILEETIKIPFASEFTPLLPRFNRYPSGEFPTTAVELDEENLPIVRFDPPNDVLDEFIILSLSIDETEDRVNLFFGCFFKHLPSILVHQSIVRSGSELED